jgi:arylsulfatase A-like enzyme
MHRLLLSSFVFLALGLAAARAAAQPPNIVLAMADDQGWGDMAYNGHPAVKTPVFDEMARTGIRFDRFYAGAPVCSPTRASVMTGRTPNRMGTFSWGYTLRPQEVTVAEALKTVGYTTGHFGKWHLGSVRADSLVCPGRKGFDTWFSCPNFFEIDPWMSDQGRAVKTTGEGSMVIVERALAFIKQAAAAKRPFLAVVWFGSPHAPHVGTEADLALYPNQKPAQKRFLAEITAMDRAMGRLRAGLRELGVADNTLLWFNSDNGAIEQGSTGGFRGRKGSVYDGGLLVPGLIEWPARVKQPRVIAEPCGTVDIYPTVLELAGVRLPRQPVLDGISLVPWLDGAAGPRPRPLGFWDYPARGLRTPSEEWMQQLATEQAAGKQRPADEAEPIPAAQLRHDYSDKEFLGHAAWIDGGWKLHRIEKKAGEVKWELYHLAADRTESKDLLAAEPERVARLRPALEAWLRDVVASLNGRDYGK